MKKFVFGYLLIVFFLAALVLYSYSNENALKGSKQFFVKHILNQRDQARGHVKINLLNLYMPHDYQPLFRALQGSPHEKLDNFITYFQTIIDSIPNQADAYAMIGFCYAYQGKEAEAGEALQRAIEANPQVFWPYYNLGLLLWQSGETQAAKMIFTKALSLPPQSTLSAIAVSKVYLDVLNFGNQGRYQVPQNLLEGYQQVQTFLSFIDKQPRLNQPPSWKFF